MVVRPGSTQLLGFEVRFLVSGPAAGADPSCCWDTPLALRTLAAMPAAIVTAADAAKPPPTLPPTPTPPTPTLPSPTPTSRPRRRCRRPHPAPAEETVAADAVTPTPPPTTLAVANRCRRRRRRHRLKITGVPFPITNNNQRQHVRIEPPSADPEGAPSATRGHVYVFAATVHVIVSHVLYRMCVH
jgi:outer membrane biosynthesis protein TonB